MGAVALDYHLSSRSAAACVFYFIFFILCGGIKLLKDRGYICLLKTAQKKIKLVVVEGITLYLCVLLWTAIYV